MKTFLGSPVSKSSDFSIFSTISDTELELFGNSRVIKDSNGNVIYNRGWYSEYVQEFDEMGRLIYFKNSSGHSYIKEYQPDGSYSILHTGVGRDMIEVYNSEGKRINRIIFNN